MKATHRVPFHDGPRPDPVTASYQRQVDRDTDRLQRRYAAAERALARAEAKAERLRAVITSSKATRRALLVAEAELELRRQELRALAAQMQASPASAWHRGHGRVASRPVPQMEVL